MALEVGGRAQVVERVSAVANRGLFSLALRVAGAYPTNALVVLCYSHLK